MSQKVRKMLLADLCHGHFGHPCKPDQQQLTFVQLAPPPAFGASLPKNDQSGGSVRGGFGQRPNFFRFFATFPNI